MRKPTQIEAFDALYAIAAGGGREQALFGSSIELARPAYIRSLIGDDYPSAYLEFPLLGEPCFDILTVHGFAKKGDRFAPGAGFGRQAMFDWFDGVCDGPDLSCGIELDTSSGETEQAGVYFQQRTRTELVGPFLESIGESGRLTGYLDVMDRLPDGWPASYIGLFPGRPGTPLRIGGYMSSAARSAFARDPRKLGDHFRRIGFAAFDKEMLWDCAEFMGLAPSVDFQFDIFPDGTLGPTFGLSLSFNDTKPRQAHECMTTGYGARICEKMQEWGLADDRWKLIADAAFARHIPFEREDGTEGRLALCVLFNYAKIKFTDAKARPGKFYLLLRAAELDSAVLAKGSSA